MSERSYVQPIPDHIVRLFVLPVGVKIERANNGYMKETVELDDLDARWLLAQLKELYEE